MELTNLMSCLSVYVMLQELFKDVCNISWKYAMVYLDDVTAYSKTFKEHLQHLEEIFKRIEKAGLKINPDKCHFGAQSLQFLGHIITKDGILPDPDKIKAVKEYSVPQNLTQL